MQHHHQPHHHHHVEFQSREVVAYAELEGEVLGGLLAEATSVLSSLVQDEGLDVRRVLDVGCGPGVGTEALAERFGDALVIAADGSTTMLDAVRERAARLGLSGRVQPSLVELPGGLDGLEPVDVAWASMVLHHVGDEVDAIRRLGECLRPGGLLAVFESAGPVRVLPGGDDSGHPGLWDRLDVAWAAWFADMRAGLPGATASAGYDEMLPAAGFDVLADQVVTVVLDAPLDEPARRFAADLLQRTPQQLARHAEPADLAALDALVDVGADTTIRSSRHLVVGRLADDQREE